MAQGNAFLNKMGGAASVGNFGIALIGQVASNYDNSYYGVDPAFSGNSQSSGVNPIITITAGKSVRARFRCIVASVAAQGSPRIRVSINGSVIHSSDDGFSSSTPVQINQGDTVTLETAYVRLGTIAIEAA